MKSSFIVIGVILLLVLFVGVGLYSSDSGEQEAQTLDNPAGGTELVPNDDASGDQDESMATSSEMSEDEEENTTEGQSNAAVSEEENDVAVESEASVSTNDVTVITYTDDGYQPEEVTIEQGDTVRFENESGGEFWPASDVHPTHTEYSGSTLREHCGDGGNNAFDACEGIESGGSYSFTFDQTGTWDFHDHLRASDTGTVIVQ